MHDIVLQLKGYIFLILGMERVNGLENLMIS